MNILFEKILCIFVLRCRCCRISIHLLPHHIRSSLKIFIFLFSLQDRICILLLKLIQKLHPKILFPGIRKLLCFLHPASKQNRTGNGHFTNFRTDHRIRIGNKNCFIQLLKECNHILKLLITAFHFCNVLSFFLTQVKNVFFIRSYHIHKRNFSNLI